MNKTIQLIIFLFYLSPHLTGQVIYVNATATGNNDGSSWTDAFSSLHDALDIAQYGDSIWLVQGVYYPDEGSGDRAVHYHLKNGVGLFGGFEGTETQFEERNWELHETILSGDIGIPVNPMDNSFTLIYTEYCDTNTIIDGLTLEGSRSDGNEDLNSSGGGLYVNGAGLGNFASPLVRNCVFQNNYAKNGGAGIYYNGIDSGAVCVRVIDCNFLNNICSGFGLGGAIYKKGGSVPTLNANISSCNFTGNHSASGGAVAYVNDNYC